MASPALPFPRKPQAAAWRVQSTHLLVLVSLSAGAVLWGWILISGQRPAPAEKFLVWLGLYGMASACFIFTRVKGNRLRFFDLPVFLTIYFFVRFGLAPLEFFVDPPSSVSLQDSYGLLLRALIYVVFGVGIFWLGCSAIRLKQGNGKRPEAASALSLRGRDYVLVTGSALYAVGFAAKLYLLSHHLYSFTSSFQAYYQNLASAQVLMSAGQFATYGLIILCIEKYRHPADRLRSRLFWAVLLSECGWGLISGMKSGVIQNFILVAVVSSLVERKFRKGWIVAALAGLILLYPVINSYRSLIRGSGAQVASFSSAASVGSEALARTSQQESGPAGFLESSWNMSAARLDLLWSFEKVISLGPKTALLQGKERWWMIPFYPFVPRFIWHSKPILDKGARLSVALGGNDTTSVAPTYPGDLYVTYGLTGLAAGMFLLGIVAQWLTRRTTEALDKRHLFVYAAIFLMVTNMEIDSFSYWTSLIKGLAIISFIAFIVYGPRRRISQSVLLRKDAAAAQP